MAVSESAAVLDRQAFGPAGRPEGLWRQAVRRLARNRLALAAAAVLALLIAIATLTALVPAAERYAPNEQQFASVQSGPGGDHLLGTDNLGRDIWSRAWEVTRISLKIGLGTQLVVLVIGIAVGATAALGGRIGDNVMMRFTDLTYAFPDLLAVILMKSVLSQREWPIIGTGDPQVPGLEGPLIQVILAIGLVSWVTLARLVRGQMLSLREADYVTAARALGASSRRIVFTHMLPNALGPVIVAVSFGVPAAIFAEALLGFIGFGLPPPAASLGTLVRDGYTYYRVNRWMLIVPCAAIALIMLSFTFLGDGLRDALDPRTRK